MSKREITMDLLNAYKTHLIEEEKSKATLEKYERDIVHFKTFARNRQIDKTLILAYKSELEQQYTVASANSMLAALNSFFRFADWYDLCVKQFRVQRKAFCSEEKEITKTEYFRLIQTAEQKGNIRLSLLIQTICGTGIRISELPYITVEAVKKGEAVVWCKGKVRKVFIVSALRKKLLRYAKEHGINAGMIFVTSSGKALHRSNVWREMKALCEQAGISEDKVFPHNLRHLFARTFYSLERDIAKLADILGHSSVNTTRIYIITTGTEHKRQMEQMKLIV